MSSMFVSLLNFVQSGGITAAILVLAGALLILIGSERIFFLFFRISFRTETAIEKLREYVLGRHYTDAVQLCSTHSRVPELQVIKAGLLALENGREAMKSALSGKVHDISRKCENRIPWIALIASTSTLLGLMGTILGLITTFRSLAEADPAMKGKLLGEGISEAMFSTATGLIVGLAAMVVHTLCTSKIEQIMGRSQDAGFQFMTWVEEAERGKKRA